MKLHLDTVIKALVFISLAFLLVVLFSADVFPGLYAPTHGLKTYKNTAYGIEFSYPKDFYLELAEPTKEIDPATHNLAALNKGLDMDAAVSSGHYIFGTIIPLNSLASSTQEQQRHYRDTQNAAPKGDVITPIQGISPLTKDDKLIEEIIGSQSGNIYATAWRRDFPESTKHGITFDMSVYTPAGDQLALYIWPQTLNENTRGAEGVATTYTPEQARESIYWKALTYIAHTYRAGE